MELPNKAAWFVQHIRNNNNALAVANNLHRVKNFDHGRFSGQLRRELKIRQQWMAGRMGIGISTMRSLERGDVLWTNDYISAWEKAVLEHLAKTPGPLS